MFLFCSSTRLSQRIAASVDGVLLNPYLSAGINPCEPVDNACRPPRLVKIFMIKVEREREAWRDEAVRIG